MSSTCVFILFIASAGVLPAQMYPLKGSGSSERVTVSGVVYNLPLTPGRMTAELSAVTSGYGGTRADVGPGGQFTFPEVPPGTYLLSITDGSGGLVHKEMVTAQGGQASVTIHLRERERARPVSGSVSVARLRHEVPGKAVDQFMKAEQAKSKGRHDDAMNYLRRAVEIDPEYVEAFTNLGVEYLRQRDLRGALNAFAYAMRLDPGDSRVQSNLAAALLADGEFRAAEHAASRAIDLDNDNLRAHYVLGMALAQAGRSLDAAAAHLLRATRDVPRARLAAAQVMATQGRMARARAEVEQYLAQSPEAPDTPKVRAWLAKLEQ